MTDHYELFGVEPDATKDEIKAAYRSEVESADSQRRAELNRAWNVLSDPIQRRRYDESLGAGAAGDDEEGAGDESGSGGVIIPSKRTTGARRGPDVVEAKSIAGNGSGNNGSAKIGSGGGKDGGSSGDRPLRPPPTVEPPEGLEIATVKARSLAMLFDVTVLLVLFIVIQFAGAALIKSNYPDQVERRDNLVERVDNAQKAADKAGDSEDKANDALSDAKKDGSSADVSEAQDTADAAKADAKAADKKVDNLNDDLADEESKLQPLNLAILAIVFVLALAYCVPSSARTGQTLGKKLRKVRLVRVDGSPAGWGASFAHYGVPIVLTLALLGILGPIAAILGFGSSLWNIRDKNRQGVNDKLAKTFVVEA